MRQTRHWRNLILAVVLATFCFGGSCECKTRSQGGVAAPRAAHR